MIIKVCGMREPDNIRGAMEAGADWIGLIFYPGSPRYMSTPAAQLAGIFPTGSTLTHTPAEAEGIQAAFAAAATPVLRHTTAEESPATDRPAHTIRPVGVFVDETVGTITGKVKEHGLGAVQLHGTESREVCEALRLRLPDGVLIIKAIGVRCAADLFRCRLYEGVVDYFLFDTKSPSKGGSGVSFDWSALDSYDGGTPFLLSGGIGPGDLERVLGFSHPLLRGIDLNSRFELAPGLKDIPALRRFISSVRAGIDRKLLSEQPGN